LHQEESKAVFADASPLPAGTDTAKDLWSVPSVMRQEIKVVKGRDGDAADAVDVSDAYVTPSVLRASPTSRSGRAGVRSGGTATYKQQDVFEARVYDYQNEKVCDMIRDIFLSAVSAVHNVAPDGFAAIKVTALGNPRLLERMSMAIIANLDFFKMAFHHCELGHVSKAEFASMYEQHFERGLTPEQITEVFHRFDGAEKRGYIDSVAWVKHMSLFGEIGCQMMNAHTNA
jgi:hypothetical protein